MHTNGAHIRERIERSTIDCCDTNRLSCCASDDRIDCFFSATVLRMVRLTGNSCCGADESRVRPSAGASSPDNRSRSIMNARSACGNMSKMLFIILSSSVPGFSRAPRSCETFTMACRRFTASRRPCWEPFSSSRTAMPDSDASMEALTSGARVSGVRIMDRPAMFPFVARSAMVMPPALAFFLVPSGSLPSDLNTMRAGPIATSSPSYSGWGTCRCRLRLLTKVPFAEPRSTIT